MKLKSILGLIALVFLASCTSNEVTSVSISDAKKTLILGETAELKADAKYKGDIVPTITWTTSDSKIATVNNGTIEGISKGTAIITASAGGLSSTCTVTVNNQISATFSTGALLYWGDFYETGLSNNYQMYLISNQKDTLVIEFNTALTSTTNIPTGLYSMIAPGDYNDYTKFIPGSLVVADIEQNYGSWFFNELIYTPIFDGYANLTNINNNYNIQYEFTDYFGNIIAGTYSGSLAYYNQTSTSSTTQAQQQKKLNVRKFKNRLHSLK